MENNINPATPEKSAAPGSHEQVPATPSAVPTPANPGQGGQSEGQVTIPTSEYAKLQRDSARVRSFEKRLTFNKSRNNSQSANGDFSVDERVSQLESEKADLLKQNMQSEIRGRVRDVLDKEEFKTLPKSTRELILKNPHMLSNADNAEEALLDIEDFVRDQVSGLAPATQPVQNGNPSSGTPKGHDTPSTVAAGISSPAAAAGLEETSNLRGVALSRAVLRNAIAKKRQGGR